MIRFRVLIDLYRLARNRDFRMGRWRALWWALDMERAGRERIAELEREEKEHA